MEKWCVRVGRTVKAGVAVTENVCRVAGMFGLGVDEAREVVVVPEGEMELGGGEVVFVTGESGGGKSTLMRLIGAAGDETAGVRVIGFDALGDGEDVSLVDGLGCGLEDAMRLLSLSGLNDAFVMLRRPSELSEGQRYRYRLARAMREAEACEGAGLVVVLADEFGATLDRVTAKVLARNVRKWVRRVGGVCFVGATTHDDLLEAIEPDVLVVMGLGGEMSVVRRDG